MSRNRKNQKTLYKIKRGFYKKGAGINPAKKKILILLGLFVLFNFLPLGIVSLQHSSSDYIGDVPDNNNEPPNTPNSQNTGEPIDDLVGLWSFEQDTVGFRPDGGSNDGSGSISYTSAGKYGYAITVSAGSTADSFAVSDNSYLDIQKPLSWGCWIYPTSYPSYGAFMWKNNEYGLRVQSGGVIRAYVYDSGGWKYVSSSGYSINTWYHVMAVLSGSTLTLYVNGANKGSRSDIGTVTGTTNPLYFGSQYSTTSNEFIGRIDDARIYRRALTQTEVQGVMNQPVYYSNVLLNNPSFDSDGSGWTTAWVSDHGDDDYWTFSEDEPPSAAKYRTRYYGIFGGQETVRATLTSSSFATRYFASQTELKMRVVTNYKESYKNKNDEHWETHNLNLKCSNPSHTFTTTLTTPSTSYATYNYVFDVSNYHPSNYVISAYSIQFDLAAWLKGGWAEEVILNWHIDYVKVYALWTYNQNPYVSQPLNKNFDYTGTSGNYIEWLVSDTCFITPRTITISWSGTSSGSTQKTWNYESQKFSIDVGALNPGSYTYTISGSDGYGGSFTDSVNVQVNVALPNAPTWASTPLSLSGGIVHVDWNVPTFNGGESIDHYNIYRKPSSGSYSLIGQVFGQSTTDYYDSDTNLDGGVTYYYKIAAVNSRGEGASSSEKSIYYMEKPTAPQNFAITAHGDQWLYLDWDPPADNGGDTISYIVKWNTDGSSSYPNSDVTSNTYYNATGLTNGQTYYFIVFAQNSQGQSSSTPQRSDDPRYHPDAPTGLTVLDYGDEYVKIGWTAPDNNGRTITNYEIFRSTSPTSGYMSVGTTGNSNTYYTDSGLTNGQVYYYKVRAYNSEGWGPLSDYISAEPRTIPSAPTWATTDPHAIEGDQTVHLDWNTPADNGGRPITAYYIYKRLKGNTNWDAPVIISGSPPATEYTFNSLTNGQEYEFKVAGYNTEGIGYNSTILSAIPHVTLGPPDIYDALSNDGGYTIRWNPPSNQGSGRPIDHYVVYRGTTSGSYTASFDVSGTEITHSGLTNGQIYYFRVSAVDDIGDEGTWCAEFWIRAMGNPSQPGAPSAVAGNNQTTVTWGASASSGGTGVPLTRYEIWRKEDTSSFVLYDTTADGTITNYVDTASYNGHDYWYRIRAVTYVSVSYLEGLTSFQTYYSIFSSDSNLAEPMWVPDPPTLSATFGDQNVSLSWTPGYDQGSPITAFHIFRTQSQGVYDYNNPIATVGGGVTSWMDTSVTNGQSYWYEVRAENSVGNSSSSNESNEIIPAGVPLAPTNMQTINSSTYVQITWHWESSYDNGRSITQFIILRSPPNASTPMNVYDTINTNFLESYTDTNVVIYTDYWYQVRAVNVIGQGQLSAKIKGYPEPGPPNAPSNVRTTSEGNQNIVIAWDFSIADLDRGTFQNYTIYRGDSPTFTADEAHRIGAIYDFNTKTYTDSGLTNGRTYYYKVRAANEKGYGAASSSTSGKPYTVPDQVQGLAITPGDTQLLIQWNLLSDDYLNPPFDGGRPVLHYLIYRSDTGIGGTYNLVHTTSDNVTNSWTDTGLTNGFTYYYKVAAENTAGIGSQSAAVGDYPCRAPYAPTLDTVQAVVGGVYLDWTAPSNDGGDSIDGYNIYRGTTPSNLVLINYINNPGTTSWTDSAVVYGTYYYYCVAAVNKVGAGDNSTIKGALPITVPDAPENLQVTQVSSGSVSLAWNAPAYNGGSTISGYVVYKQENGGTWVEAGTTSAAQLTFTANGLTNGLYYNFKVAAYNNGSRTATPGGEGANSTSVNARPITVPGAPENLQVILIASQTVQIQWSQPSFTGGVGVIIDGYVIYGVWVEVNTVGGSTFTFTDSGLTNGYYYNYKVAAWNNGSRNPSPPALNPGGEGANSTSVNARPITVPDAPENLQVTVPDAPENLQVFEEFDGMLWLKWDPPSFTGGVGVTIDGYVLYRGFSSDNLNVYKIFTNPSITEYNDTGLTNGLYYYYAIAAYNNGSRNPSPPELNPGGEGAQSNVVGGLPITVPTAPLNFQATSLDGKVLLQWDDPSYTGGIPLTGYVIYRGTSPSSLTFLKTIGDVNQWYDDGSVQPLVHGLTYYYKIAAYNNGSRTAAPGGEGENSTETPHATPTLYLDITILDAAGNPLEGAVIRIQDIGGTYDSSNISITGGKVGLGGLNNSNNYKILITKNNYVIYNVSNYVINTNLFVLSKTFLCNLTNVVITLNDLTDNLVIGAYLELNDPSLGNTFSGYTNDSGQIEFREIYNGSWNVLIKYTTGGNNYEFTINDTDVWNLQTALELYTPTLYANLTTIYINATDPAVHYPWDALYNANITLVDSSNGQNITWFLTNSSGIAEFQVPAQIFNMTITYLNKSRKYYCENEPINLPKLYSHQIDFNQYTNFHFKVEINEISTTVFCKQATYFEPTWGSHDSNYELDDTPNYAIIYYRDGIIFKFFWQNNRDLSGIDNTTVAGWNSWEIKYNALVVDDSFSHPYALQPVNGEQGNYTFTFNSSAYGLSGTYIFNLILGDGDSYQYTYYTITITVMNFTSSLTLTSNSDTIQERTCYYGQYMTIQFDFSSVLPIVEPIDEAVLNWYVIGQPLSGTLTHIGGTGSAIYEIQHTFTELSPGAYQIRVYGNETNYDYVISSPITIQINSRPTQINATIDPLYKITDNYLVTAWQENITVDFELLDTLTSNPLSGITIYIEYNSTVYTESDFCVVALDADTYRFTIPANWSSAGMHTLYIRLSLANYTNSETTINVQIEEKWNTNLEVSVPPESAVWEQQVNFTIYYYCDQQPRSGTALVGANITQLEFYASISGSLQYQTTLLAAQIGTDWNFTDLGSGYYNIWFNTHVLNLTERTLFYIIPTIEYANYKNASISLYLYVRPLAADLTVYAPNNPSYGQNFVYLELDYEQGVTETIMGNYEVDEAGHIYEGMRIDGATGYYEIRYYSNNSLIETNSLVNLTNGRYYFLLFKDKLGEYKVNLWIQKENYEFVNYSFRYKITKDIQFDVEIDPALKITGTSLKLASNENITLIINVTDPIATNPVVEIYIDDINMDSTYIYQIDTKKFKYTQPINDTQFALGEHTVKVIVSQDQFNTQTKILTMQLIDKWASFGLLNFKNVEITTWGNNISFDVLYYATEEPRNNYNLSQATITQIIFTVTISGNEYIQKVLTSDSLGTYWYYEWNNYDPFYDDDTYKVWVNSSVLNLTKQQTFKIYLTIEQQFYQNQTFTGYCWITTVDTSLYSVDGDILEMGMKYPETFKFILNVSDESSGIYGQNLNGAILYYKITNTTLEVTGSSSVSLGNGLYEINIDPIANGLYNGTYTLTVTSSLENFTDASISVTLNILPGAVRFNFTIENSIMLDAYSIRVSVKENATVWITFEPDLNLSDVVVEVFIDNGLLSNVVYPDDPVPRTYKITFNASITTIGQHELRIKAAKFGYATKKVDLNLEVISTWETSMEIIIPPPIKPWNTNISFIVRYESTMAPREGLQLTNGIITQLKIDLITDLGRVEQYTLKSNSDMWGWENLKDTDPGAYMIWLNTSILNIPELRSFYVAPTIIETTGIYSNNTIEPYLWVKPVKTQLSLTSSKVAQIELEGITLQLNETTTLYALFNVSDPESILNGQILSGAIIYYSIYNKTNGQLYYSVPFNEFVGTNGSNYQATLIGLTEGVYTVKVYSSLVNYSSAIAQFDLHVIKRTLMPKVEFNTNEEIIKSPQNRDLVIRIEIFDELSGQPLSGATLTVELNGKIYQFHEMEGSPGVYFIQISVEDIQKLTENEIYTIKCSVSKYNYTEYQFEIYLNVGFRVDPVFGIPYRYWMIGGITILALASIVTVRKFYLKATTPIIIQNINTCIKIIRKKKRAPKRRWAKLPQEEIASKFDYLWKQLSLDVRESLEIPKLKGTVASVDAIDLDVETEETPSYNALIEFIEEEEQDKSEEDIDILNKEVDEEKDSKSDKE
ncbi:MAG: fibronectin type III domain-containing protein [Promethearchaeota archaeon]